MSTTPDIRYDDTTALIVVDVQNDFAHPDGSLYVEGAGQVIEAVNEQVAAATQADAFVVYTQDWHPESTPHFEKDGGPWPVHCVGDTWGAQFHDDLDVAGPSVKKGTEGGDGYSGFTVRDPESGDEHPTQLDELLRARDIQRVVVVGLAQDYCVKETAVDARRLGYETEVPTICTAPVDMEPGDGKRALEEMREAGATIR